MGSGSAPGEVDAWCRQVAGQAELAGQRPGAADPPAPAQRLLAGSPAPPDAPSGCASASNPHIFVVAEEPNPLRSTSERLRKWRHLEDTPLATETRRLLLHPVWRLQSSLHVLTGRE